MKGMACRGEVSCRAALALLLCAAGAAGQVINAKYECSATDYAMCETELKNCLTYVSQYDRSNPRQSICNTCYAPAWMCYRDCKRYPSDFARRCSETCSPDYSSACSPPEYAGPKAGALSTGLALAALVVPLTAAVRLLGGL